MNWQDISIENFYELEKIQKENNNEDFLINAVSYLYKCNADQLPISIFLNKCNELEFLNTELPKVKIKKYYTLNNREYEFHYRLDDLTTAQYFDFTHYATEENNMVDMLSIVMIPRGKKYMDGYDIDQVKADLKTMSIVDANAVHAFFLRTFQRFIKVSLRYLTWQLRLTKMEKTKKKQLRKYLTTLTESFRI